MRIRDTSEGKRALFMAVDRLDVAGRRTVSRSARQRYLNELAESFPNLLSADLYVLACWISRAAQFLFNIKLRLI